MQSSNPFRVPLACLLFLTLVLPVASGAPLPPDDEVEDLIKEVEDKQGGVRAQGSRSSSIRKLVRTQHPDAVDTLVEVFADAYAHQREVVILETAKCDSAEFLRALLGTARKAKDGLAPAGVIEALALRGNSDLAREALSLAKDRRPEVQAAVALAAGRLDAPESLDVLANLGKSRAPEVARAVGRALIHASERWQGNEDAIECARKLLKAKDGAAASLAVEALARLQGEAALDDIDEALVDKRSEEKRVGALLAYRALGQSAGSGELFDRAVEKSIGALEDKSWRVKAAAIDNGIELWDQRFIAPIIKLMLAEEGRLRLDCGFALTLLCDYDNGTNADNWQSWWEARKTEFQMPEQPERGEYGFTRSLAPSDDQGSTSFFDIPVLSKRCIFQFDFSGSMARELEDYRRDKGETVEAGSKGTVTKISIAQDEAAEVTKRLAKDARFNFQIHRYIGARNPPMEEMQRAFPKLSPASPKNRAAAEKWVRKAEVDGWGAFYNALIETLQDDDVDTIFMLTDGVPSGGTRADDERFIQGILEANRTRRITIHSILLKNNDDGHSRNAVSFMQDLAQATGGLCVLK